MMARALAAATAVIIFDLSGYHDRISIEQTHSSHCNFIEAAGLTGRIECPSHSCRCYEANLPFRYARVSLRKSKRGAAQFGYQDPGTEKRKESRLKPSETVESFA